MRLSKNLRFSDSLSIETTLSIEFTPENRALWTQFPVVLYKTHAPVAGFYENGSLLPFSIGYALLRVLLASIGKILFAKLKQA